MGNTRGNTYSKNHTRLDTCSSCRDFWNFGWQEAGRFDLAGVIDYILNLTGNDGVYYVGHSQGTTEYLVGQIIKPIKIHYQCDITIHFSKKIFHFHCRHYYQIDQNITTK